MLAMPVAAPNSSLLGLRLRTNGVELRLPTDRELLDLCRVAAAGIHDPATMPFAVPWTDVPPEVFEARFLEFHRNARATLRPDHWRLPFGVWAEGVPVGVQEVAARAFARTRAVETGSWLGRAFQGRGIGRLMRSAVLHFAFEGLGAEMAWSPAFETNDRSRRVSEALGYRIDGRETAAPRGVPLVVYRYRLDRTSWAARPRPMVEMSGVGPCLPLLGVVSMISRE